MAKPDVALGRLHTCGVDSWRKFSRHGKTFWRCGPCNRKSSRDFQALASEARPARRLWWHAKKRASVSGVPFNITIEDIEDVWPQDNRCPVLGMPLEQGIGTHHGGSPTLDQLDPAEGYQPDNIAVISYAANRAKGNLTATQLERLAAWMRSHGLS